ncbi:acyl-CoA synthetase [Cupriavidus sp. TA19]|uniref:acetate--CoA ligase family protein n=1 Tax=Cupriavidus sp. TA19 TaxID=701108 RepID=UPI00272947A0|nr:acetate--CoA ligase family protein [Cupriavidus sp. TA19]GLC91794.1 acyl-CoA synthetase [Cupriavidus sp. TA19]
MKWAGPRILQHIHLDSNPTDRMTTPSASLLRTVDEIMTPRSIAVIGASEDPRKFGGRILRTLLEQGFHGTLYPVNAQRGELLGHQAYPSIDRIPGPIDLAIMAIPREHVLDTIAQCAKAGVKGAIVVTSKFSDAGDEGAALERDLVEIAHRSGMRILGPNCIGIISPVNNFVLCPSPVLLGRSVLRGEIGFVSQSGAVMGTIFDRAISQGIGFSHCISIGNQGDLELCDFVDYLIDDPATRVICSYVEGIKRPQRFDQVAARARQAGKPWLIVKAGRTEAGAAAAFSHTASLAGSHAAFAAVCREQGVLLIDEPEAMFLLAAGMSRFPGRTVDKIALLSPSGGGCAMATDRLVDVGGVLATFSTATVAALDPMYPGVAHNPVDIGAANDGASMSHTEQTHRAVLSDVNVDLSLTVITAAPDIARFAEMAADGIAGSDKPSMMVLLPGRAAEEARALLRQRNVLHTDTLDSALRAISAWREWSMFVAPEMPVRPPELPALPAPSAGLLGEQGVKDVITAYGIGVNHGRFASTVLDVASAASQLTSPYVLKIVSSDIVHKTDVGGVALGLEHPEDVETAARKMWERVRVQVPHAQIQGFLVQEQVIGDLELLIGLKHDDQFGPMVVVGAGGVFTELLKDVVLARAPVSSERAVRMLRGLRIAPVLDGMRGKPPIDIQAAAEAVSRLSWLAHDWGASLKELDINPLLVRRAGLGCVAVDGRALLC